MCCYGIMGLFEHPNLYEIEIRKEMAKLGATEKDFSLLTTEVVINGIKQWELPEHVAWALMQ